MNRFSPYAEREECETAEGPFFSPDGKWVAFVVGVSSISGGGIPPELRNSLATGLTQTVCSIDDYFCGAWPEDDSILFFNTPGVGVWSVPASGGEKRQIIDRIVDGCVGSDRFLSWPALLPGGRALLVAVDVRSKPELAVLDLEPGELVRLGVRGTSPRYLPTGHLVFGGPGATLEVVPFDLSNRRVTGSPVAVVSDLAFSRGRSAVFAVAGTLVATAGWRSRGDRLAWLAAPPDRAS